MHFISFKDYWLNTNYNSDLFWYKKVKRLLNLSQRSRTPYFLKFILLLLKNVIGPQNREKQRENRDHAFPQALSIMVALKHDKVIGLFTKSTIHSVLFAWKIYDARRDCYLIDFNSFLSFNGCLMTKNLHKSITFEERYYILVHLSELIYGGFSSSNEYNTKANTTLWTRLYTPTLAGWQWFHSIPILTNTTSVS